METVSARLGLADALTTIPHKAGPQSEFSYRIAWVKTWLKAGGMRDNPQRAVWVLTETGRRATESEVNDLRLSLRRKSSKRRKRGEVLETPDGLAVLPTPALAEPEEFADDDWQNDLLSIIKEMEPAAFERLARLLLLRLGFSQVEVVGRSGDGGIDLLGLVKVNTVLSFRVLAQCKRYKESVGPGDIRNFRGAMQGRTDKGIFLTSGRYTSEAKKEASRAGVPEIDLVDGEALTRMLKDLGMGVATRMVEQVTVERHYFLAI